jgi:hypothetical protein
VRTSTVTVMLSKPAALFSPVLIAGYLADSTSHWTDVSSDAAREVMEEGRREAPAEWCRSSELRAGMTGKARIRRERCDGTPISDVTGALECARRRSSP